MPECTEAERKLIDATLSSAVPPARFPPAIAEALAVVNAERVGLHLTPELREEALRTYVEAIRAARAEAAMEAKLTTLFGKQVCEGLSGLNAELYKEAERSLASQEPTP